MGQESETLFYNRFSFPCLKTILDVKREVISREMILLSVEKGICRCLRARSSDSFWIQLCSGHLAATQSDHTIPCVASCAICCLFHI